jgi:hypothetical protein
MPQAHVFTAAEREAAARLGGSPVARRLVQQATPAARS